MVCFNFEVLLPAVSKDDPHLCVKYIKPKKLYFIFFRKCTYFEIKSRGNTLNFKKQ